MGLDRLFSKKIETVLKFLWNICVRILYLKRKAEIYFHLAALIQFIFLPISSKLYKYNVNGTLNLLEAAKKYYKLFVQTSTSEVYGSAQYGQ